ncbi:MAG: hypothetical protein JJ872_06225 [Marivivens sp.]|nr:hypothetical protein [Marivivens sp.]
MSRTSILSAALSVAHFTFATQLSAEIITWRDNVAGWYIGVDRSRGDGCYIHSGFERGGLLRVGFDMVDSTVYTIIGDDDWKSLEADKIYPLTIKMGNNVPWIGDAEGFAWEDGRVSLAIYMNVGSDAAVDFVNEIRRLLNFQVFYQGKEISNLSLRGSNVAIQEAINCQVQMNENAAANDPFSNGGNSDDPFR